MATADSGPLPTTTKEKEEAYMANPLKFPEWESTDKDCAKWMNDALQEVSTWTFIQLIANALNLDSGWYNFLNPFEWIFNFFNLPIPTETIPGIFNPWNFLLLPIFIPP